LGVLGMVDCRQLIFAESTERYDDQHEVVVFIGKDRDKIIRCMISRAALEDHFNADDKNLINVFNSYRERIQHEARLKYLAGKLEQNGDVLVKTEDI
ncbi:MAG: hypothetical protein K0Q74_1535, partial [Gammaproteobacteria bacterium]|nr:hypothetical protein [Gammaproteobacteria bacterium]